MAKARRIKRANVSLFAFQDIITSVTGVLILIMILMLLMLRHPQVIQHVSQPPTEADDRSLAEINRLIEDALATIAWHAALNLDIGSESVELLKVEIARLRQQIAETKPESMELAQEVEALELELAEVLEKVGGLKESVAIAKDELEALSASVAAKAKKIQEMEGTSNIWLRFQTGQKHPLLFELNADGGVLRDIADPEVNEALTGPMLELRVRQLASASDSLERYFVFFIRPSGIPHLEPLQKIIREEGFDLGYRTLAEDATLHILPNEDIAR